MFRIPQQNNIVQSNESDFSGVIDSTRNIDLKEAGKIKLASPSYRLPVSDNDWSNVRSMYSAYSDWDGSGPETLVLSTDAFKFSSPANPNPTFTNETTDDGAPSVGENEDVIFFTDWVITDDGAVKYRDSGSWTSISGTPVSSSHPNVLGLFPYQNSLLVGSGNEVAIVDTSWNVTVTLVLPDRYEVQSIESSGLYAYIGVLDTTGNRGALFRWNGATATHNGIFEIEGSAIDSVFQYKSSVACVTNRGQLLYFTGSSFQELAKFPTYDKNILQDDEDQNYSVTTNRGVIVDGDDIYISVTGDTLNAGNRHAMNGGIWCYNPKSGLSHLYSPTRNYYAVISVTDGQGYVANNTITVPLGGNTIPPTGTPIFLSIATSAGLKTNTQYFIIKTSSTAFQIASTPENAYSGTALDLTQTGTFSVYLLQINDYGQTLVENSNRSITLAQESTFFFKNPVFSGNINDDSVSIVPTICAIMPFGFNTGYFVTTKIRPSATNSKFSEFSIKYKRLNPNDKIKIKYRTQDDKFRTQTRDYIDITWTDSNTFTSTDDLSSLSAGDEMTIYGGQGAGQTFYVESLSESSGTWTVNLTEENDLVTNGDDSLVTFSNWKLATTIDYTDNLGYKKLTIDTGSSAWIQYKIELEGMGTTIEEILVDDKPQG